MPEKGHNNSVFCSLYVKSSKNVASICCDQCNFWVHKKCSGLTNAQFKHLQTTDDSWYCKKCKIENPELNNNISLTGKHSKICRASAKAKPHSNKCQYCSNVSSDNIGWYFVQCISTTTNYKFCTKSCFELFSGNNYDNFEILNCSICYNKIGNNIDSIFVTSAIFGRTGSVLKIFHTKNMKL